MTVDLLQGDCREVMAAMEAASIDLIIADPPYNQTSLIWDRWPDGWLGAALRVLKPAGSMWVFGTLRMFMDRSTEFEGWRLAQDLIWEKHNGTNSMNDRFRRVHEQAAQFYRSDSEWDGVFKKPIFTDDAVARTIRRKKRPPHWNDIGKSHFVSKDGGPKLMRSVMFCRSEHGRAVHPTQKPVPTILPMLEYSLRPGGLMLDPFAGAGSSGVAARILGSRAILIEADPEYFAAAQARLSADAPLFQEAAQ